MTSTDFCLSAVCLLFMRTYTTSIVRHCEVVFYSMRKETRAVSTWQTSQAGQEKLKEHVAYHFPVHDLPG
jgi:hypothetical protein